MKETADLLHFTDFSNLNSIISVGYLCSRYLCYANNIEFADVLDEEEVNNIYRSILKLNVNSKLMSKKHVKNIKKQLKFENEKISNNICPRCGKRLVYKLGKNGVYLGCTGYPKCRFIKLY